MEKFCKLNSPEIVCECAISDIKAEANKFAHQNLKTYLYNKFPKVVEDCMITTGYVNSLKNRYSAFCYSQNAEDIKTHGTSIDLLKQKFPEKVNQCSCAQDVINNMDDRRFMQYSVEANQTYQKRVVCIKACLASSSKEQCQQQCPKTTSPVTQAIEDKCGPLNPSPLKNWLFLNFTVNFPTMRENSVS